MATAPIYNFTDLWNAAGTTYDAIKVVITNTASAAASDMVDVAITGGASFGVNKSGVLRLSDGTNSTTLTPSDTTGLTIPEPVRIGTGIGLGLNATGRCDFVGGIGMGASLASPDIIIARDAANQLALRRTTNPQAFHLYNTFTSASVYERGRLYWTSNEFTLSTEALGGGSSRGITITPVNGTLTVNSGGTNTYISMAGPSGTGQSLLKWDAVTTTNICGLQWNRPGSFSSRLRYDGSLGDLVWYNTSSGSEVEKWRLSLNGNMNVGGTFATEDITLGIGAVTALSHTIAARSYNGTKIDSLELKTFSGTGDNVYARVRITTATAGGSPGVAHFYTINGTILSLGGITSSFPGMKNSGTELQVRLADDSGYAPLACGALTLNATSTLADAVNVVFNTTTGTKLGTATTQKIGVWNATPIVQPSATGETTGFTAGVGTAVLDDSTFTGNVGSTAYRISDIVKHLKNIGLIAA